MLAMIISSLVGTLVPLFFNTSNAYSLVSFLTNFS